MKLFKANERLQAWDYTKKSVSKIKKSALHKFCKQKHLPSNSIERSRVAIEHLCERIPVEKRLKTPTDLEYKVGKKHARRKAFTAVTIAVILSIIAVYVGLSLIINGSMTKTFHPIIGLLTQISGWFLWVLVALIDFFVIKILASFFIQLFRFAHKADYIVPIEREDILLIIGEMNVDPDSVKTIKTKKKNTKLTKNNIPGV